MTTIKLKNGSGAPTAGDLVQGEPALDLTNKRLYTENASGTVIEVGTNPGASGAVTLNYSGSAKLATTSTGIDVTGSVTADGGTFDGNVLMNSSNELQFFNTNYGIRASTGLEIKTGDFTRFLEGSTEHMRIASGGDVSFYNSAGTSQDLYWDASTSRLGLGTTSPAQELHIVGTEPNIRLDSGGTPAALYGLEITNGSTVDGYFRSRGATGETQIGSGRSSGWGGHLTFYTDTSERMRIDSSGNVGIGTASPAQTLHVSSTSAGSNGIRISNSECSYEARVDGGEFYLYDVDDARIPLLVDTSGNVGIGTNNPTARLEIAYSGGSQIEASNGSGTFRILNDGTNSNLLSNGPMFYQTNATGEHIFQQSGGSSEAMRINSSGRVGIGSSGPASVLDIRDTSQTLGFLQTTDVNASPANLDVGEFARFSSDVADANLTFSSGDARLLTAAVHPDNTVVWRAANVGFLGESSTRFYTGGSERMRLDGSGNVGINNASPDTSLNIGDISATNATGQGRIKIEDASGSLADVGGLEFVTSSFASGYGWKVNSIDAGGGVHLAFGTRQNATAWSEKMRLDSSGNLLVGKSSGNAVNTAGIEVDGNNNRIIATRDGNEALLLNRLTSDGAIVDIKRSGTTVGSISVTSSATAYNTSSDQRLKDNIVDAPSASDDIDAIQIRSFDWKADGSHQKYGMIAQELQTVAPDAVTEGDTEEDMMSVDYSKLVPMLVKEIQSLRARVAQLEGAN